MERDCLDNKGIDSLPNMYKIKCANCENIRESEECAGCTCSEACIIKGSYKLLYLMGNTIIKSIYFFNGWNNITFRYLLI